MFWKILCLTICVSLFINCNDNNNNMYGTVEDNGKIYKAYDNLFNITIDGIKDKSYFSSENLEDIIDTSGYHVIQNLGWSCVRTLIVYRKDMSPSDYYANMISDFNTMKWEYQGVYENTLKTDCLIYYMYAYTIHGKDPFEKYINDMYLFTVLGWSDSLQIRYDFINRSFPKARKKFIDDINKGTEKNSLLFLNSIKFSNDIYNFNIPDPVKK